MIIAQITDLHVGFDGKDQKCRNSQRLLPVIYELNSMIQKPDLVLVTGDLVETGEKWAYEKLRSVLGYLESPYHLAIGNHDNREVFRTCFPEVNTNGGFVQYSIDDGPLRVLMLDTLNDGLHGGAFCETRAAWLDQALAEKPDQPTLIAMHHPPINTGIAWMTASRDEPWVQRFEKVIDKYDNIRHVIAGHIHRTMFQKLGKTTISVCEAIAPEVKLELAPIDEARPDDRPLICDSAPRYSLHQWDGETVTSHMAAASTAETIVRFDEGHQYIIQKTMYREE